MVLHAVKRVNGQPIRYLILLEERQTVVTFRQQSHPTLSAKISQPSRSES